MKKQFTILAMFLAMTVASFAQYTINITSIPNHGSTLKNLAIGVHPEATDYIDSLPILNEYEISMPSDPEGGAYFTFRVPVKDNEGAMYATYRDFRKEDTEHAFKHEYLLRTPAGASEMKFTWIIPDNPRLDSAYFTDDMKIGDNPQDLFFVDMLQQSEYTITNSAWKYLKIVLVFKDPVSVEETENEELAVYPNPTSDYLKINMDNMQSYKIFDVTGQEIMHGDASASQIDVSGLEKGFYNIVLIDYNAKMQSKKFIKL